MKNYTIVEGNIILIKYSDSLQAPNMAGLAQIGGGMGTPNAYGYGSPGGGAPQGVVTPQQRAANLANLQASRFTSAGGATIGMLCLYFLFLCCVFIFNSLLMFLCFFKIDF